MTTAGTDARRERIRVELLFTTLGIAIAAILPFFPLLLRQRGLDTVQIGTVLAAMALVGLVAAPLAGHASDTRFGPARTLRGSIALTILAALALWAVDPGLWATTTLAVVLAAGRSVLPGMVDAITIEELGRRGHGDYGSARAWMSASFAIATLAFGGLYELVSLELLLPVYAVAVACCLGPLRGRVASPGRLASGRVRDALRELLDGRSGFGSFLVSVLLLQIAVAAVWNYLPLRMEDHGGGLFIIGAGAAAAAAVEVPVLAAAGRLARGRLAWEAGCYLGGAVVYLACFGAYVMTTDAAVMSLIRTVSGVGFALTHVGMVLLTVRLVPDRRRATGLGVLQMVAHGIAPATGAWLGGIVYHAWGSGHLFVASASMTAIAIATAVPVLRAVTRGQARDDAATRSMT